MKTSGFIFSKRSLKNMEGIHPDLYKVLVLGLTYSPYDFGVSCGVRTIEDQKAKIADGSSPTLKSAHLIQPSGFGHAVDLYVLVDGKQTWEHKYFRKVVQALVRAAITLGVQIEFGALWRDFLDSPHVQLSPMYYGGNYK